MHGLNPFDILIIFLVLIIGYKIIEIIYEKLRGEFGDSDADIIRNIVIAWLSEKSFISSTAKKKE